MSVPRRSTRPTNLGGKSPSLAGESRSATELNDHRVLIGDDNLTDLPSDEDPLYEPDDTDSNSDTAPSASTEDVDSLKSCDDDRDVQNIFDVETKKRNVFQSHFSRSSTDQTRIRTILQSLSSYWSLLSTLEALPLPPLPSRDNRSSKTTHSEGGSRADDATELPMLDTLEELCSENIESQGLKEAMGLVTAAGLHRRVTGATKRGRGPHHIIWRDVAAAITELRKEGERQSGGSHNDGSDGSGNNGPRGKRKRDTFEGEDSASVPRKKRPSPRNRVTNAVDDNVSLRGRNQRNGRKSRAPILPGGRSTMSSSNASRNASQRSRVNRSNYASKIPQSGPQEQSILISSESAPSSSHASISNHSPGRRPTTRSPAPSPVSLGEMSASFNYYHSPSASPSRDGSPSASSTSSTASGSSRKTRRSPSFGSRAFKASSKVYPLYPWMEANRGVSKKKAVNNDDSGYEDVFDADDDYEMGDFLDEGSLEGLESPHYSFASTPNLSPLHSTMPNSNSVPGVNALLSHSGVEYSQGQLPTPQKTPAPNRFTPTTLLPSFQKLRDFGKRALFSNQSSTLHRNSTSRRPNTIIETIQRERLADTDIATVPVTAYRGRPRAFSDVKRVKLRRGERLVTVSDDEE